MLDEADRAAPSTTSGTPRRREATVFAAVVTPAERLGFGRSVQRAASSGPFRPPRASAGQLCGGHRSGESVFLKTGGMRNDCSAPGDVAKRAVRFRAEA